MKDSSTLLRQATLLCGLLAVALAVVLMAIKHQVRMLEDELDKLNGRIAFERQSVQVLTAEFNFFSGPERLKRLATAHLGLVPIETRQLATFAVLDAPAAEDPPGGAAGSGPRPSPHHRSTAALGAPR